MFNDIETRLKLPQMPKKKGDKEGSQETIEKSIKEGSNWGKKLLLEY